MFGAYPRAAAYLVAGAVTAAALAGPALAAGPARIAVSAEARAEHAAVARLNVAGQGHCTATLIAPDLALTAAHCLDPRGAAERVAPGRLHVLAGWRKGRFTAHYRGSAVATAPGWRPGRTDRDAALIRLAPVSGRPEAVAPLPVAPPPAPGDALSTLSYGRDRAEALSRQTGCRLVGRRGDLLLTDCEATPGVSGAPLLVETAAGPALVGVVVAAEAPPPPALRGPAVAVAAAALLPGMREALATAEAAR
jgi:hypothetical protein